MYATCKTTWELSGVSENPTFAKFWCVIFYLYTVFQTMIKLQIKYNVVGLKNNNLKYATYF